MEKKVLELLSEHFGIPVSEIQSPMELRKDFNASDLEVADFLQALESTFHVTISKEEAVNLITALDVINFINDHAEEPN
ncbi:hypothetical protein HYT17_00255 [Candidatus Microgenomates bacterium]|nr:hypothetical protein [Candidatus Microgenomates bacterium]